jgi:hypothetical protein
VIDHARVEKFIRRYPVDTLKGAGEDVVVRGSGHGTVTLPVRAEVRIPPSTHDSGFEDTLIHLVKLIKAHVEREDAILFPALAALNAEERESLRSEAGSVSCSRSDGAVRHAPTKFQG